MGWPRYDPRTGFWLCEGCWNKQNWTHHCAQGLCECPKHPCAGYQKPAVRVKFSRESLIKAGQTSILDGDLGLPIQIGPKS